MEYFAVGTLVLVILALLFAGGWLLLYNRKLVDRIPSMPLPNPHQLRFSLVLGATQVRTL
jgi:hypothetical protein